MPVSAKAVLVVEDEILIRMAIADEIADGGFAVYEAGDADEAIRQLEAHADIGLVFTDIDMPGSMDGLKLARAVRDRWPPVKIILTSGHVTIRREELPVDGQFVAKPYDSRRLVALFQGLLAG